MSDAPEGREALPFWEAVSAIVERDGRYTPEAYGFVMEAIDLTVGRLPARRHVSAAELLQGFLDLARHRFGYMATDVVRGWGIVDTGAVGDIVFQLIDAHQLSRREEDSREEFDGVFDLGLALEEDYFGGATEIDGSG